MFETHQDQVNLLAAIIKLVEKTGREQQAEFTVKLWRNPEDAVVESVNEVLDWMDMVLENSRVAESLFESREKAMREQIDAAVSANSRHVAQLESAEENLKRSNHRLIRVVEERDNLRSELNVEKEMHEAQRQRSIQHAHHIQELMLNQQRTDDLFSKSLIDSAKYIRELQDKISNLSADLLIQTEAHKNITRTLNKKYAEFEELDAENSELRSNLATEQTEVAELKKQLENLENWMFNNSKLLYSDIEKIKKA
jgi:hypothetical protein